MAQVTREEIITKHATLDGAGAARFVGDYVVLVVPGELDKPPAIVAVQDAVRDYVFRQHAHDTEPRDYVAGPWEALILES